MIGTGADAVVVEGAVSFPVYVFAYEYLLVLLLAVVGSLMEEGRGSRKEGRGMCSGQRIKRYVTYTGSLAVRWRRFLGRRRYWGFCNGCWGVAEGFCGGGRYGG